VVGAYLKEVANKDQEDREKRIALLQDVASDLKEKMRKNQDKWKGLAKQAQAADPKIFEANQKALMEELAAARHMLRELRVQLIQMRDEDRAGPPAGAPPAAETAAEPIPDEWFESDRPYQAIQKRIADLEDAISQAKEISRRPDNPRIRELEKQLEQAKGSLAERRLKLAPSLIKRLRARPDSPRVTRRTKADLERAREMLDKDIEKLEADITDKNDKALMMEPVREELLRTSVLTHDVVAELDKYDTIEKNAPARAEAIGPAEPPRVRDTARQIKLTGMAGGGTFLFVLFGVALVEFRTRRITGIEEVVRGLGLRLVGSVPALPGRARRARNGRPDPYWQNLMAESVDAARTLLLHAARTTGLRLVMVTSALPGEGKTSLTTQLATSLARAGRKTLLIDCDLRKPAVHRLLDLPLERGVSDVLRGDADITEVIRPTQAPSLAFVSAGTWDPAAQLGLAQYDIRQLFELLRADYDFIVVDSSPVLCVTDALLLGQCVDGVLFSILRDVSRLHSVHLACERLEALNIPVLGAVVNGVRGNAYGSGYSSYHLNGPRA
jgi:capsular exopolysaccharide synthesis family protein